MRGSIFVLNLYAVLLFSGTALAQVVDTDFADYEAPPTERRGGFVMGISAGGGFGSTRGYPNQLGEIDNPAFLQEVDGFSAGNSVWIGGGLRDWLTVAFFLNGRQAEENEVAAQSQAFGIRVEGFPLYALGGFWKDVGVLGNFGAAGGLVQDQDKESLADGGIMSALGFGVFYEPWQFWQFSAGPQLDYTHEFSESLKSHALTVGLRLALYGAQP